MMAFEQAAFVTDSENLLNTYTANAVKSSAQ